MINYHKEIVEELQTIGLPVHYEMFISSRTKTPCISYMEITNFLESQTDKSDVGKVVYQVKVWSSNLEDIQTYSLLVDSKMRGLEFMRTGAIEMVDTNSAMIQKVLTYQANTLERIN